MVITTQAKYDCAKRELAMRERVYPRWISQQKMNDAQAHREIETMRAIVEDYRRLCEGERLL